MIALGILVLWIRANAQQGPPPPAPTPGTQPCVAFLLPNLNGPAKGQQNGLGDVFASCWGRTIQLTKTGDISSWALDFKSNRLLLIRANHPENRAAELVIVTLNPWKQEKNLAVNSRSFLVASCGTVLLVNPFAVEPKVVDAISGLEVKQQAGGTQIRCDGNGGTIASLQNSTSISGGPLLLNGKALGTTVADFDVSPNGRFLAFNEDDSLCIYDKEADSKSCLRDFRQVGRMSIWDDGTVVVAAETSQACPLSQRLTTQAGRPTWPCPALFEWRNGARESLIQFLATNPQILPPATGKFLFPLSQ
jgi:hypothetical protein